MNIHETTYVLLLLLMALLYILPLRDISFHYCYVDAERTSVNTDPLRCLNMN